jgi:hypothetical protein
MPAKKDEKIDGVRYITVPVGDNLDDATVEDIIRQLAPPVAGIVGNYADVQRAGAAIVKGDGSDLASGVETPPGVTDTDIAVTKAVEDAVEASRTGEASSVGDSNTGGTGGTTASRTTTR